MKKTRISKKTFYLLVLIFALTASVLLAVLRYDLSFRRLIGGVIDLYYSICFYFTELFSPETNTVTATVNELPDIRLEELIPWDWDDLARKFKALFPSLFTKEYFMAYMHAIANFVHGLVIGLTIAIPVILFGYMSFNRALNAPAKYSNGEETKPLRIFKKTVRKPFLAVSAWIYGFLQYAKGHKLVTVMVWLWVFNLNIATIIIEFIAYYLYFAAAFDLLSLFVQLLKLFVDLIIMFGGLPLLVWSLIGTKIFDLWRKSVGYNRLNHNEMKNRVFINSLPVVCMACGTMAAKKTTLITDMQLSADIMFRDKALELLFKNDMKLPNFPWQRFEDTLRREMENGGIFNLASIEQWIADRRRRYAFREFPAYIYGYDVVLYREKYNDDLSVKDIFDILETYAKLYFIYVLESSLILANYSVRTDNVLLGGGHFPLWRSELFRTVPGALPSKYAHVIDFDLFRLGNTIIENSKKSGALEFGVIGITEIGKERQNNLELKELKKSDLGANQKNDLFNSWLKMARHPGVVDNFTFVKVFTDEQRPESWGADARDLCVVIDIMACSDIMLAMPGFLFGDLFYDIFYEKFKRMYYTIRHNRGDQTLFLYVVKNLFEIFVRHYVRIYNRFGVMKMKLGTRAGTLDSKTETHDYFLAVKKIYADRFSTDCYSEYFRDRALRSKWSLITAPEYENVRASLKELNSQNSYFIRDLNKTFKKEKED